MIKNRVKTIISIFGVFFCLGPAMVSAQVGQTVPMYLAAFVDRQSLGVTESTQQLHPVNLSAVIGLWVRRGIGLEFEAGVGVRDDRVGALDVATGSTLGLNVRLESPPSERYAAYALFGYVRTDYDTKDGGINSSLSIPGGRVGLGMTYRLVPKLLLDASFTHHDYDDDTRINSFRFGVRFDIGPDTYK